MSERIRADAISVFGEQYVLNIERMARQNAAALDYTAEGWESARAECPFLVEMQFALDPDGSIGMRGQPVPVPE